jgi:hypothetical protein
VLSIPQEPDRCASNLFLSVSLLKRTGDGDVYGEA